MTFQYFPHAWGRKFDLADKMSAYGHHLNKLGRPWLLNAIYQDSAPKLSWFWRRRFLSVSTIYGHGSHLVQFAEPFEQIGNTLLTECPMWNLEIITSVWMTGDWYLVSDDRWLVDRWLVIYCLVHGSTLPSWLVTGRLLTDWLVTSAWLPGAWLTGEICCQVPGWPMSGRPVPGWPVPGEADCCLVKNDWWLVTVWPVPGGLIL